MPMNYDRLFQNRVWLPKLGEITLSSLLIALISGMLLIPGFQSALAPFKSVSHLINSGLFGHFLHSCHAYAADLFLAALFLHALEYVLKQSFTTYDGLSWLWLALLAATGLAVVFSGFLSLGSMESQDALHIARNIFGQLGNAGQAFSRYFLLGSSKGSVLTILLHHAATFSILSIVLTFVHLNRLKADGYAFYYTLILIALLAVLFPAGIGTAPGAELAVVKGPWYFRGLQEMLSWQPAWVAGIVFPLLLLLVFALLPLWTARQTWLKRLFFILIVFYLIETFIATFLRGAGWQLNV